MTDTSREQQAEALIAQMKAARGYMYPEWEFAARQDPEFVAAYNRLYELGLGEGQHVAEDREHEEHRDHGDHGRDHENERDHDRH